MFFDNIAPDRILWINKNRAYYHDLCQFLALNILPESTVLEIGCGIGNLLAEIPSSFRVGIDFSEAMVCQAKQRYPDCHFVVATAEQQPFDHAFDYIILSDLLGHLNDVSEVMAALHQVVGEHTRIIITTYNYLWHPFLFIGEVLGWKMPEKLQNWLDQQDIRNFLELEGFEIVRQNKRLLFPRWIPLLSSLLNRVIANLPIINNLCLIQFTVARRPRPKQHYAISVIVPVRNEAGTIGDALRRIPAMGNRTEVIFIEGNSSDNTAAILKQNIAEYTGPLHVRWMQQDGQGKGDAVRMGFAAATGDILMILDGDLTVPPETLPRFYAAIRSGQAEFINGSRLVYPMEDEAMRTLNLIANKCFSLLFTWMLGQPCKDTLCGTKVIFTKDYLRLAKQRDYFGSIDPFGDFDLLFGAARMNLKMREVAVIYRNRSYGETNIDRFAHGWLLLKMSWLGIKRIKWV